MKRVVVLGGGFAGVTAVRELAKDKSIEIFLIDKHSYHNLQPQVYDLIANESTIADVTVDLFNLCQGINHPNLKFLNLRVENINVEKKEIHTEEGEMVSYDYLVIATGSRTFFPMGLDGISNTNDIKKLHKALFFKQSFETEIYHKIVQEGRKCESTQIVVVGAGLSGVEIAAEMAYYAKRFFKRGLFACNNMKITLISGSSTVLPGLNEQVIMMCQERLKELGVEIITRTHMEKADENFVHLSNGNQLRYSFVIFAGGIEASNLTSKLEIAKNKKGQILVNEFLQSSRSEIFAIGDVAEIKNADGSISPPNVTTAKATGKGVAHNILNEIHGRDLVPVYPKQEGILIALGGRYAVGDLYGKVRVKGFVAYLIKHFVFYRYRFPLLRLLKRGYHRKSEADFN